MKYFVSILFFLSSFVLYAQDYCITGTVCDSVSGKALQGANIIVRSPESGRLNSGTTSNINGDFLIRTDRDKSYLVLVTFIGYKPVQFVLEPNQSRPDKMTIRLSPSPTMLNEVVVNWKPLLEYGNDGSIALNLDMLGNIEGLSAADALEMIPGFHFDFDDKPVYNGFGDFTILVNGETHRGILIGAGFSGGTALYTLRSIPAKNIKRVEIIPEPMGQYGFFSPVINLVTKGELMDIYNARAGIGTPERYDAGLDFSKKIGKIRINPSLGYALSETHSQTDEKFDFLDEETPDYNRRTDRYEEQSRGQASLDARYTNGPDKRIELRIGGSPVYSNKTRLSRASFFPDTNKSSVDEEHYDSRISNWETSFSLFRRFKLNTRYPSSIGLVTGFNHRFSKKNENQQTITEYLQKQKQLNTKADFKLNYNIKSKKLFTTVNLGYDYQNNYNFSDRLERTVDEWHSLLNYFRNKRLQRSITSFDFRANRKLGKSANSLQLAFSGVQNLDRISEYQTGKTNSEDNFRLSGSTGYSGTLLKQRANLSYQYRMLWPTSTQLMATPEYINENTMRVGNPDLKPGHIHAFSFLLNHGYQPGAITLSKGSQPERPIGYEFKLDYNLSFNGIESSHSLVNDSILALSFANSSKQRSLNLSGNLFYLYRNKFRVQLGGMFGSGMFFDNTIEKQSGNNWSVFTKFRLKIASSGNLELKYRYNSHRIAYQSKVHGSHEASMAFSRNFLKNNLMIQAELGSILNREGIRTEYFGDNFYSDTILKNDSPIFTFRLTYLLFSFYDRQPLD